MVNCEPLAKTVYRSLFTVHYFFRTSNYDELKK